MYQSGAVQRPKVELVKDRPGRLHGLRGFADEPIQAVSAAQQPRRFAVVVEPAEW